MSPQEPSIWLKHSLLTNISPDKTKTASFVEYLRWMRVKGSNETENSGTILELFEKFEDNDFSESLPNNQRNALSGLLKTITWLMLHLGGVGQGARRPCYSRKGSNPPWRGVTLEIVQNPKLKDDYWVLPQSFDAIQATFVDRLKEFYKYLQVFSSNSINVTISRDWEEAVDSNCEILICQGSQQGNKNFALSTLHSQTFKIEYQDNKGNIQYKYDPKLCGGVNPSIPSPVWIRHIDYLDQIDFQVVTVFGAKTGKRKDFVKKLREDADLCLQIFPIDQ
jgi:CRISPR-associated protein Cmr6